VSIFYSLCGRPVGIAAFAAHDRVWPFGGAAVQTAFRTIAAGLLATLAAAPALAADPIIEAPGFNWSGFYAGVQAGYAWGNSLADYAANPPPGRTPIAPRGGLVGAYAGYNHAFANNVVLGIDADVAYANVRGTGTFALIGGPPIAGETDSVQLNWSGAARVRLGMAVGRVLPYVAGGVAFGGVAHQAVSANPNFNGSWRATYIGYTVGAGADFAVTDMIVLRGEYRFTDFGRRSFGNPPPITLHSVDLTTHDVRFGLAVKF
jgi:outer membrane immunogenic protein